MVHQGRMREVNRNSRVPKFVRRIEMVQKRSIMYYQLQSSHPFLKIVVALPTMVTSCRGKNLRFINCCSPTLPSNKMCSVHLSNYIQGNIFIFIIIFMVVFHLIHFSVPHYVILCFCNFLLIYMITFAYFLILVSGGLILISLFYFSSLTKFILNYNKTYIFLLHFQHFLIKMTGILDRGIQIEGFGMKNFVTYESNVLFALRFMVDCNIVGGNWIEVPAGKYKKTAKNLSYCQLEFDCLYPHA